MQNHFITVIVKKKKKKKENTHAHFKEKDWFLCLLVYQPLWVI